MLTALSVTETVSWGILYYAFAVLLVPMQRDLGWSAAELTGAFSLALLVSGVAGIAVGRHLDRRDPRVLMTAGSLAGVALLLAWSQVEGIAAFYAVWAGLGLVMAAVLYEPAFVVLAKTFTDSSRRRRAMTTMTLAGALASFIFLPLTQALVDAHGWRDALLVLAVILAVVTVPLHAVALRTPRTGGPSAPPGEPGAPARAAAIMRSSAFRLSALAFFLSSLAGVAMTVHAIPFLLERGYEPGFAAFAVGLIGISQIPGRLVFAGLALRLEPGYLTVAVLSLIAAGIAVLVAIPGDAFVIGGLVVLGMGNGMATLARASGLAERYGAATYGTIAGVAAAATTAARALGPFAAAGIASLLGYPGLLWTLAALAGLGGLAAYAAERSTVRAHRTSRNPPRSAASRTFG